MPGHFAAIIRLAAALRAAPDRLVLMLLWVTVVAGTCATMGVLRPVVVAPALVIVAVLTWRIAPTATSAGRGATVAAGLALLVVGTWMAVQAPYTSRYVVVDRDPGFLTLAAIWLGEHGSRAVPLGDVEAVAGVAEGVRFSSGALTRSGDVLQIQGASALPAVLATGTWVAGDVAALAGGLVIGALALLAVYGFARRIVGPWWALVPVGALATSVPFAVFTRAAYTEPLTMALVFCGLTLGHSALSSRRLPLFAGAGLAIGSSALVRIDGATQVAGLLLALAIAAALTTAPRPRRRLTAGLAVATVAALGMVALGYLDLATNSHQYLRALGAQFAALRQVLIAVVVAGVVLVAAVRPPVGHLLRRHAHRTGLVLATAVGGLGMLLVSRPWWYEGANVSPDSAYGGFVASLQAAEGLPVEPWRSYDEYTLEWLAWYHGWPAVVLAFTGLAGIAWATARRRDPRLLLLLGVAAAPSALYLWSINITPDQVWAVRRLLPVTIPGFLVAAAWAVAALWRAAGGLPGRASILRWVAPALAAVVVLVPATAWGPLFTVREHDGRYGEMRAACDALRHDRVILVSHGGPPWLETLRLGCDVEVVSVTGDLTTAVVRDLVEAWGGGTVDVVAFAPDTAPWTVDVPPVSTVDVTQWNRSLMSRPDAFMTSRSSLWVGSTAPDGSVVPVERD